MKRYASCYCRYSTDKQQQQSIEYQLERIEDFCKKHDITLIEKYIDEASSGSNDQRRAFQQMIDDSEHSKWGYLLVYDLSRLARSVEDQMFYQKVLKQRGIMIISVEEKFDSSPEGHLFSIITAGINEYYAKHLAKRSFAGVIQNARKGLAIGGIPPLGYDVNDQKQYIINKKEAESVRIIFKKVLEGWSHEEIKDYLNEKGYKSKLGRPFTHSFYETLRNRKYIGEYIFNQTSKKKSKGKREDRPKSEDEIIRIEGGLPQIIDKETFDKVQHLLDKRSNVARLQFKPTGYLLTGLLECSTCKHKYSGATSFHKGQAIPYLRYTHFPYTRGKCRSKDVKVEALDNWITKIVIPDMIKLNDIRSRTKDINAQITIEKKRMQMKIDELNKNLSDINKQLEGQAKDLVKNAFSMFALEEVAELKDRAGKFKREIETLERRKEMMIRITIDKFNGYVRRIKELWESKSTHDEKMFAVKKIISKISISNDDIIAHLNYDGVTKRLCDFDIEIASIKRDVLVNLWKKSIKKVGALSDN
jgi:site-specific DNA recombinase